LLFLLLSDLLYAIIVPSIGYMHIEYWIILLAV